MNFSCYIHIEKCAGTTLHHSIKYNKPGYLTLRPWYYWSNEPGNHLKSKELKWIKRLFPFLEGIGGHTTRTFAGYEDVINTDIAYFTFLRNPIDRYLSHFNHQVNKKNINWSIDEFLEEKRFNNYITKRIAGEENLELAKKNILNRYSFIGLFESFDESVLLLNQFVFRNAFPPYYEIKNDSKEKNKIRFSDLSKSQKDKLISNNEMDLAIVEFVKVNIYPEYRNKYKGNLIEDLESFSKINKIFKYNRFRYLLIKATRIYTEKIVEPLVHKLARS